MAGELETLVARGRAALAGCDWAAARSSFEQAAQITESGEVLDGLGQALYWLGEYPPALALRERAYACYYRDGDHQAAAFVAFQLAALHWLIYGNAPATGGWIAQAQRMIEVVGDCRERGWVELFVAAATDEPDECERRARVAMEIGRRFGDVGLEFDALACVGRALVARGLIAEGMSLIDEAVAAAASGVVADPWAAAEIYCSLFGACELAVDVKRAQAWLDAVDNYVERTGELPVFGICRMHYGGVLTAAGRWADAERELVAALGVYDVTYRGTRFEPLVRLADLRVRQGRLEEAQQLLDGYEDQPGAAPPGVRLHLARGEPEIAATLARRHLAHRGRGTGSAPVLALLVEAELACGRVDEARQAAEELARLGAWCAQPSVCGLAALSQARVAVAGDDTAVPLFERALAAFAEAGLPCELARARLELAQALVAAEPDVARAEARAAFAGFHQVGAARDADAAASLLRRLGDHRGRSGPKGFGTLTKREAEVLALVAEGLSNGDIAERLYISPRTAEHHVGSILGKLGLSNRAEAAAHAMRSLSGA